MTGAELTTDGGILAGAPPFRSRTEVSCPLPPRSLYCPCSGKLSLRRHSRSAPARLDHLQSNFAAFVEVRALCPACRVSQLAASDDRSRAPVKRDRMNDRFPDATAPHRCPNE
jgi:hypothetical protein